MKRSAIVTMRASSSVGTLIRRSGRPSHARPSVSAIGAVVSVSTDPASTSTTRRRLRNAASSMPLHERWMNQKLKNGVPGANTTWARKVSPTSHSRGLKARQNHRNGTPLMRVRESGGGGVHGQAEERVAHEERHASALTATNLARGSSRCMSESPG